MNIDQLIKELSSAIMEAQRQALALELPPYANNGSIKIGQSDLSDVLNYLARAKGATHGIRRSIELNDMLQWSNNKDGEQKR
jgi:hypothetical protein